MRVPDNEYCITSKESDEKFFGIAEDLPLGSPMAGQRRLHRLARSPALIKSLGVLCSTEIKIVGTLLLEE